MRLEGVRFRGMGPAFPDEVSIDFTSIPGKILAVTGRNMAGKSSLLELILPGVLYRDCPTRGPLRELAGPSGSFLEATVVNGQRYTIRHDVENGIAGMASVLDEQGKEILANRLVSTYDAWGKKKLPPKEVALASLFGATTDLGILRMESGSRKAILLKAVGVDQYIPLAKKAGKRRDAAKGVFDVAESRCRDEKSRAIPIEKAKADLAVRSEELADAENVAALAAEDLAEAEARGAAIAASNEETRRLAAALEAARTGAAEADRRLASLRTRLDSLRETLDAEPEIRAASDRVHAIDAEIAGEIAALKQASESARASIDLAKRRADTARGDLRRAEESLRRARTEVDQDAMRAREREACLVAASGIPDAEKAVADAEARARAADTRVATLQETRVHGAESRIHGLQGGLVWYQNAGVDAIVDDAGKVAADALNADRELEDEIRRLPEEARAAATVLRGAKEALAAAQRALSELVQKRDRAHALTSPPGLQGALLEAARAAEDARTALAAAEDECAKVARPDTEAVEIRLTSLRTERARIVPVAGKIGALEGAHALRKDLEGRILSSEDEVRRLQVAVDDAEAVAAGARVKALPDLTGRRAAAADATKRAGAARTAMALAERTLQEATASAERLTVLEAERDAAAVELGDWTRLTNELGPDGLQALEIDAAGPEISDLTNALLHKCVSTRFTVSVETTAKSEDSDRETCEIRVLDSENGLWTRAERLSGAGGALVGEALRWALVILTCRRWKIEEPTIVRDEAGATLEPANARAYVAMLRQAADMVGASRVLFVSQSPEIQALADARIHVEGGKVSIEVN